jgi:hypothetical protein
MSLGCWQERTGFFGVTIIWMASLVLGQMDSQVSASLSYNMSEFSIENSIPYGHEVPIGQFQIIEKPKTGNDTASLVLEVGAPLELFQKGTFKLKSKDNNVSQSLQFNSKNDGDPSRLYFIKRGAITDLNELLTSLRFIRNSSVDRNTDFEVTFSIFLQTESTRKDSISQKLVCFKGLKMEVLMNKTNIVIYQGERFSEDLIMVLDNKAIMNDLSIRTHPSSALSSFFSVNFSDGLVWVEGNFNSTDEDPKLDKKNPYRISFAVRDTITGIDSETYTFYLQVESRGLDQTQKLKLIFLTAFLFTLVVILFFCAVVSVRREKKQMKEQVKKEIQQEIIPENILTKSILEWNKEVTSTRDQSHKESLLFNPYDKYSLKKKHQDSKPRQESYDQIVSHGSKNNTSRSGTSNYSLKPRKGDKAEKNQGALRLEQEPSEKELKVLNGSKLEFSRAYEIEDKDRHSAKELEFGEEFSQITGERQETDEEENTKKEADPRLEDIILKEF